MRNHFVMLALTCMGPTVVLTGCATHSSTEAYDRCVVNQADGWKLIPPPPNSAELLSLQWQGRSMDRELTPKEAGGKIHEHWFQRSRDELQACRHNVVREECDRGSTVARFERLANGWVVPDEVLISICVGGHRRD